LSVCRRPDCRSAGVDLRYWSSARDPVAGDGRGRGRGWFRSWDSWRACITRCGQKGGGIRDVGMRNLGGFRLIGNDLVSSPNSAWKRTPGRYTSGRHYGWRDKLRVGSSRCRSGGSCASVDRGGGSIAVGLLGYSVCPEVASVVAGGGGASGAATDGLVSAGGALSFANCSGRCRSRSESFWRNGHPKPRRKSPT